MPPADDQPYGSRLLGPEDQDPTRLRVRVQTLLTVLLVGDNVIGAVIATLLAAFVIPSPAPNSHVRTALAVGVPLYVLVATVLGTIWITTVTIRKTQWLPEGREPSAEERAGTLRTPLRATVVQAVLWALAVVVFTTGSMVLQPGRALATVFTVAISGMVTSGFAYVLTEFAMRPISARVLTGSFDGASNTLGIRYRQLLFWLIGTGAPVVGIVTTAIVVLVQRDTTAVRLAWVMIALGIVVLVFGSSLTALSARALVGPIVSVRDALLTVEKGELDVAVTVYDGTEVGAMQAGFNEMVAGLREREHLRDVFGRHVGRDVAAAALEDVELGGESREVSVLFVDLVGSTSYADGHEPTEVVTLLNRFFGVVVEEVDRNEGLVNKFVGDAVLAVFGAPRKVDDHASKALAAARAMGRRLAEEVPEIGAGVGVATGEVVAGNVGDESRFEFTVIGDAVNAASRITDLAKDVDGRVLAAWASVEAADEEEAGHWEQHGSARLRGRSSDTDLAVPTDASPATS